MSGRWGWRAWLGIAVSVVFLALLLWRADLDEVVEALRGVQAAWFAPAALLLAGALWLRALRWRAILRPSIALSRRDAGSLMVIGLAANNVLPARTGEVVRALLLRRRHGASSMTALGTIVVERVFDGLVLALLLATTIAVAGGAGVVRWLALLMGLAFALAMVVLAALVARPVPARRLATWVVARTPVRVRPRLGEATGAFVDGLTQLRGVRAWAGVLALSAGSWMLEAGAYWMVGLAFGLDLSAPLYLAVAAAANLAIAAPSTAGGVGPYEFFAREVAVYFGVGVGAATAYALVLHAFVLLPVALLGLVLLWRQHLSVRALVRPEETLGPLEGAAPRGGGGRA